MFEVRCAACKRVEEWEGGHRSVRLEGGARRPAEPGPLAAWRTIADAHDRGAKVVGPCPACGQPLVSAAPEAVGGAYVIDLPGPDILFDDGFVGPDGAMGREAALTRIKAALPPPPPPEVGRLVFTGVAASMGGVGLLLWFAAGAFVLFFLVRGAQTGMLWGQRGTGTYAADFDR